MIESSSMFHSSRIFMTAMGWIMYGSPVLRSWPSCAFVATSMACSMRGDLFISILYKILKNQH